MSLTSTSINLLKTEPGLSPQLVTLEANVRRVSIGAFLILVVVGVGVGLSFLLLQQRYRQFEADKSRLVASVAAQEQKEGSMAVVKQRLGSVQKILSSSKSWAPVMETVTRIDQGITLTSLVTDEKNRLTMTGKTTSIDRVVEIAQSLAVLARDQTIRSSQFDSLQLNADGSIQIRVSFIPSL